MATENGGCFYTVGMGLVNSGAVMQSNDAENGGCIRERSVLYLPYAGLIKLLSIICLHKVLACRGDFRAGMLLLAVYVCLFSAKKMGVVAFCGTNREIFTALGSWRQKPSQFVLHSRVNGIGVKQKIVVKILKTWIGFFFFCTSPKQLALPDLVVHLKPSLLCVMHASFVWLISDVYVSLLASI